MSGTVVTFGLCALGGGWAATYAWMRAERDKWRSTARDLLQQKIDAPHNDNAETPPASPK